MKDYICRQAAIGIIQSLYPGMPRVPWLRKDWQKRYEPYIRTENAIRELPSAPVREDVQPVRETAEWVYGEKDGADGWYCSKCRFHIPWYYDYYGLKNIDFIRDFRTCPHCDAKMLKYTGMKGEWND